MSWLSDWAATATAVKANAEQETCPRCGTTKTVGYSNLGVPVKACPHCQGDLVENGRRPSGEVLGMEER